MQDPSSLSRLRPLAAALILATSFACGTESKDAPPPAARATATAEPAAADASEEEEDAAALAKAPGVPVITPFGVPECDNYVKKFMACVEGRVPEAQKENLLAAFEANRTKWRALASMREGALALGIACKAAAQKSKEELAVDYGCEF